MRGGALTSGEVDARLLLSAAVVVLSSRTVGRLAARVGQPAVIGEIVAGLLLGPSLLGAVWPGAESYLFADPVVGALRAIAQVGLVMFMFLIGVELDLDHIRNHGRRAVTISLASIAVPLVLGAGLSVWLHPRLGGTTGRTGFALFMGAAMAITAFPVLARILQERGMATTRVGVLALACAAVDDVTAWFVLAASVAVVKASGAADVARTAGMTLLFIVALLGLVRPLLGRIRALPLPVAVGGALLMAWVTDRIGIHPVFGAFIAGAVLPHRLVTEARLTERLEAATTVVLLPIFFVVVGLDTRIGLLDRPYLWGITLLVVATAVLGKLGGSALAARAVGETPQDAWRLGVLMNTRGLTEIVILTVGLELGVISETLFTIMVIMALATTVMAAPLLAVSRTWDPAEATGPGSPGG